MKLVALLPVPVLVLAGALFVMPASVKVERLHEPIYQSNEYGDTILVTDVELSDGSTVQIIGGRRLDGSGMVSSEQELVEVGDAVDVKRYGKRVVLIKKRNKGVVYAYNYSGHRWQNNSYSYYINHTNPQPPATMTPAQVEASLAAAAKRWILQTGANIAITSVGLTTVNVVAGDHHNAVFWREGPSDLGTGIAMGGYYWYDGTGFLYDADMIAWKGYGTFYPLTATCVSGAYRIYDDDTRTHEFGHLLGFSHSTVTAATMYPSIPTSCDKTWRTLHTDDIAMIQAAYGLSTAPVAATTPYAPTNGMPLPADGYLRWMAMAGASTYDVYLGSTVNPPLVASLQVPACNCVSVSVENSLFYNPGTLAPGTYYWKIVAKNSANQASSAVWMFTK